MLETATTLTVALEEDLSNPGEKRLRRWIDDAVSIGAEQVTIELDAVTRLEMPLIVALLEVLRTTRKRGADVRLATSSASIRATLRTTGLDKLFVVIATPT